MPQRTIWCVCEYHRALTLQRGDAHFIVLPSVTSVCVFSCLKASPTPPCLLHGGVPCASLASSPVHTAEETHLIGQGLPWEVLGDASLIYYTHTSQGHQRKGILSTPPVSPRVSLPLSLLLSLCSHMPNGYTKTYIHMHGPSLLVIQWGIIHLCLAPGSPVVLYCFSSFDFFHAKL